MYDKDQIADAIREVLTELEKYTAVIPLSEDAVHIMLMLGAHESHFGMYLTQKGGGPALGFYQIEPATENDVLRYLRDGSKTQWKRDLYNYLMGFPDNSLMMNLWYQTVIARVKLWMIREPLPSKDDLPAMAMYCKKYWNTNAGKAKPEDYLVAYKRYVRGDMPDVIEIKYIPKGGMCSVCDHKHKNCSHLDFTKMKPMSTGKDGEIIVICTGFKRSENE